MICPICNIEMFRQEDCDNKNDYHYVCKPKNEFVIFDDGGFWIRANNTEVGYSEHNNKYYIVYPGQDYSNLQYIPKFDFKDGLSIINKYLKMKAFS